MRLAFTFEPAPLVTGNGPTCFNCTGESTDPPCPRCGGTGTDPNPD